MNRTVTRITLRGRHRLAALAGVAALAAACGTTSSRVEVGTDPSSTSAPVTTPGAVTTPAPSTSAAPSTTPTPDATTAPACRAADLQVAQTAIGAGTSRYYQAWSLTNVSASPCTLSPGRPVVRFENAAGRSVVRYAVSTLPASTSPVTVAPGAKGWFLSEELQNTCTATQTLHGGPFHYRVTLPDGTSLTWSPSYLSASSVVGVCTSVALAVGGLTGTEPTP